MVRGLEAEFRANGFRTARQVPARSGRSVGYIDLMAEDTSGRIVCVEVEMSTKRVPSDLVKAVRVSELQSIGRPTSGNCVLWIVVPDGRVKEAARRTLSRRKVSEDVPVLLLTYGQALTRLREKLPFFPGTMPEEKRKQN